MQKKKVENETDIKTTVMFTYDLIKCSRKTNVFSKIIITKVKLQAINDAIVICSKEILKNSQI